MQPYDQIYLSSQSPLSLFAKQETRAGDQMSQWLCKRYIKTRFKTFLRRGRQVGLRLKLTLVHFNDHNVFVLAI